MQGHTSTNVEKRTKRGKNMKFVIVIVATGLLSGCGLLEKVGILSAPEPPAKPAPVPLADQPYELNLRLSASSDLNPDNQSRPSPVQVRVFVTEPQSEIGNKEFEEMFDYAGNYMDPRPLSTVTLRPGQTRDLVLPANKSQSLLVIAVAYHDPYQSLWKAVATVTPQDTVSASANIDATTVTINASP